MNPHEAFSNIAENYRKCPDLNADALTELTGVRRIEKIADGKGDETATFLNDELVLLTGFYKTIRILNIKSGKSWSVSRPAYPVVDRRDVVFHNSKFLYYAKPNQEGLAIYEYDITQKVSKPVGTTLEKVTRVRYDPDSALIQLSGIENKTLLTIDLDQSIRIDHPIAIPERNVLRKTEIKYQAGAEKITFTFNNNTISIPYSSKEFLVGIGLDHLLYDENNPDGIIVQSRWYPGLYILFDFKSKQSYKVFFPQWIKIDSNPQWRIIDDKLFIWLERTEREGMYMIELGNYPVLDEFVDLLCDYELARKKSGVGWGQRA